MNRLSVIQYMGEIKTDPYVHAFGELPNNLLSELTENWPDRDITVHGKSGDNVLVQYQAKESLEENKINPIWKEFIEYHTSQEFIDDLFAWCPYFDERLKQISHNSGIRWRDDAYIKTDAMFCIDTPVVGNPVVKRMHLDNPKEFYKFLLRFPGGDYDTQGFLQVGKWKDGRKFSFQVKQKEHKYLCHPKSFDVVATNPNVGIYFYLNSSDSLHGISGREPNKRYRRYFNIVGHSFVKIWEIPKLTNQK